MPLVKSIGGFRVKRGLKTPTESVVATDLYLKLYFNKTSLKASCLYKNIVKLKI